MKKKLALCFLVFALVLTCASAMAANIKDASAESGSSAKIEKQSDQTVKVTYDGQKDKEYVVMAVAKDGVDSAAGKPTKETIGNNQDGVVVYMDQAKGNSEGKVEFTVHPNLDKAKAGDEYFIYISSNVANSAMTKVGSFSIDDIPAIAQKLGDANGDGVIDGQDVSTCVDNFTKGVAITDTQKAALDVDHNGILDGQDVSMIVDCFTKGVALQ